MPTPSMQGSKLPRMFPTSDWGKSVSASEHKRHHGISGAASSASSISGQSRAFGTTLSSLTESTGKGGTSSHHATGSAGAAIASSKPSNVPSKMSVLEQYISRFRLDSPMEERPIQHLLEGGHESVLQRSHRGGFVRFADEMKNQKEEEKEEEEEGEDDEEKEKDENEEGEEGNDEEMDDFKKQQDREVSSKRAAREAAKMSFELLRRQKVDSWIKMAERNLKKVRRENETLSAIARLTQSNALVNDERYEKALEALRAEAELADELRQAGFGPMMHEFAERIDAIQRDMNRIVVETNKRTIEELAKLRENFEKELERYKGELESERNSGLSTKLDWIQKNRDLHRAVTEELFVSDELARDHVALESLHRRHRLDASLTEDELLLLEEVVANARRQNSSLKDRLGTMECELSLAQAKESRARADRSAAQTAERHAWMQSESQQQQSQQQSQTAAAKSSSQSHLYHTDGRPPSAGTGGGVGGTSSSSIPNLRPGSGGGTSSNSSSNNSANQQQQQQQPNQQQQQQQYRPDSAEPHPQRPHTAQSTASTIGGTSSSGSTDEAVAAEAQTLFDRINQTIAIESRNLQTARHAHSEALKQRTELEVYLKYAILQYQTQLQNLHYSVRHGIKANSGGTGVNNNKNKNSNNNSQSRKRSNLMQDIASAGIHRVKKVEPTVFTVEDRQAVVDSLLSLPRVLTLMFDPVSAANRIRRKQLQKRQQASAKRQKERELARQQKLQQQEKEEEEEQQHEEKEKEEVEEELSAPEEKLYDDLAKLGVDVVANRTSGFLFTSPNQRQQQSSASGSTTSAGNKNATAAAAAFAEDEFFHGDDEDDNEEDDEYTRFKKEQGIISTSNTAPLDEEELWQRWNEWSQVAEKDVNQQQQKQRK